MINMVGIADPATPGTGPGFPGPSQLFKHGCAVTYRRRSGPLKGNLMKTFLILAGAATMIITAPASAQSAGHILRGTAIGAGAGALAGAIIPGMSVGTGALVGAAGGTAYNALHHGHRRYYQTRRSRVYYRHHR